MAENAASEIAQLSYEQARDELVRVVQQLEQGGTGLEQSLVLWERGEALAAHCEEWLAGAKERLAKARSAAASGDSSAATGSDSDAEAAGDTANFDDAGASF